MGKTFEMVNANASSSLIERILRVMIIFNVDVVLKYVVRNIRECYPK